ncbi:D-2-hydroxyacid dehydrogenase [Sedimentibacter sp.]|uniref:D-2-hydroxyacid dehydrogenase n=1 Tax=Sedimentibacter sp. TaxID=1960295 RepID=UPI002899041D|nr:D-2-hydroxyacid dehydrogenase [Sedimentibacter sp.]
MKIVILDGYTLNPGDLSWEELEKLGDLTVYDRTPVESVYERIKNADVVFTNKTPLSAEVISKCSDLKYIGVLATGYNIVDVKAARERNIPVSNIPVYGTAAVAQMAIALLLEVCHHAGAHSDSVHKGDWASNADWCYWNYPLIELAGKTMGIIGYGRIGQSTARIAEALGMNIISYDGDSESALDELLAKSDVICLHCPLFPSTEGIINKNTIAKMRDGVIIINNSRGQLIVEQDLADALNSGKVYAAGLDVVSSEPIKADNPLLKAKNCIITPHISWAPKESRLRLMGFAIENLETFLKGEPTNIIN